MRQRHDARALLFADRSPVNLALLLILLLSGIQCSKLVVPVGLEGIRYTVLAGGIITIHSGTRPA